MHSPTPTEKENMPPPPTPKPHKDSNKRHHSLSSLVGSSCSTSSLDSKKAKSGESDDGFETVHRRSYKKTNKIGGPRVDDEVTKWTEDGHGSFHVSTSSFSTPLVCDPTGKRECNQCSGKSKSAVTKRAE